MKIGPLTKPRHRPVAILIPGRRSLEVITDAGSIHHRGAAKVNLALSQLAGHVCFAMSRLPDMIHTTGALSWRMELWRGRPTRMIHAATGVAVTSLRGTLDYSSEPFTDLAMVLDWLATYNVPAGSISAMSWALFRASLGTNYTIGFDPEISQMAMFGGRQEAAKPARHENMASFDIRAAYPVAMASRPYALSLHAVHVRSQLDPDSPGLVEATVHVPEEMPWAPLPVRIAPGFIRFQHGTIQGVWPWVELAAAKELGCDVKVTRLWAPRRTADLFASWWPLVAEGRGLPGGAGLLAKAIANSTWGQFGMVGTERSVRQWTSDDGAQAFNVDQPDRAMPHEWTAHVAAETTARIRTRMLLEGLYSTCRPVYVDTDGIIAPEGSEMPPNSGPAPGQWRVKETMPTVEIRGPQFYRWTCGAACGIEHAEWHYNCAGVPDEDAPAVFAQTHNPGPAVEWVRNYDQGLTDLAAVALAVRDQQVVDQW